MRSAGAPRQLPPAFLSLALCFGLSLVLRVSVAGGTSSCSQTRRLSDGSSSEAAQPRTEALGEVPADILHLTSSSSGASSRQGLVVGREGGNGRAEPRAWRTRSTQFAGNGSSVRASVVRLRRGSGGRGDPTSQEPELLPSPRRKLQLDESPRSRLEKQQEIVTLVEEEDREAMSEHKGVSGDEVDEIAVSLARHSHTGGLWTQHRSEAVSEDPARDHPHSAYALNTPEGDAREAASVAELARVGTFNLSDPSVRAFSRLADKHLLPWTRIEGVALGMGSRGMISPVLLDAMSTQSLIMEGCAHIKVVDGTVYFRYGGFMFHWFRLRRLLHTVKMIQDAVTKYKLSFIRAEFFLNTRDVPMSFDNSLEGQKAGYPVFSVEKEAGSMDIVYPDPIDLSEGYLADEVATTPWKDKEPRAVFRGATTNYPLKSHYNWRVNPRLRLHRMTDVRPDLMDARVMGWSHVSSRHTRTRMAEDQLVLGKRMSRAEMARFKYEIVVDGAAGSSRTCNTLGSDQVMIKQESQYSQFFAPLLQPYKHYIPTTHFFDDLFDQIQWARAHDEEAHKMVAAANNVARQVCTWRGRTLYWAILLFKYWRNAMENPSAVKAPMDLCKHEVNLVAIKRPRLHKELPQPPPGWPPSCTEAEVKRVKQPACTLFCQPGLMKGFPQIWVPSTVLEKVARTFLKKFEEAQQ